MPQQSNLLIRNVVVTYARMLFTVGFGLYATRLLYHALSEEDIGIFNVLGASIALIEVIRYSLTVSAVRNLSISKGMNDDSLFARTANSSYLMFCVLAVVLVMVAQLATPLLDYLNMPNDRRAVAFWVFQFSILGVARVTLMAPINAIFVAQQAFVAQAILTLPLSIINLSIIALLFVLPGDRLMNFACLNFLGQTLISLAQLVYCFIYFPLSRPSWQKVDRSLFKDLARFASWSALGDFCWQVRSRGTSILLNLFFGPIYNAAWELTDRTSNYQQSLISGVRKAVTPMLIAAEGGGRRSQSAQLLFASGKFSGLASLFFTVPFVLDSNNVLKLWLDKELPANAETFVQLMSITLSTVAIRSGCSEAMQATDDIGQFTRRFFWLLLLPIPLAAAGFWAGYNANLIVLLTLASSIAVTLVQVSFAGLKMGYTMKAWLQAVLSPVALVAVSGALAAMPARFLMPAGFARFSAIVLSYCIMSLPVIWFVALDTRERNFFVIFTKSLLNKTRTLFK